MIPRKESHLRLLFWSTIVQPFIGAAGIAAFIYGAKNPLTLFMVASGIVGLISWCLFNYLFGVAKEQRGAINAEMYSDVVRRVSHLAMTSGIFIALSGMTFLVYLCLRNKPETDALTLKNVAIVQQITVFLVTGIALLAPLLLSSVPRL
jgi:hypothetical protein